jgi:WD40 repeat protein
MPHIFVSYAREDAAFVRGLVGLLQQQGRDAWVDWEGIPPTAEWLREIYRAIDAADALLFIISPASAASEACRMEVEHAVGAGKRLVPLVLQEVPSEGLPPAIAARQWLRLPQQEGALLQVGPLLEALDLDLDWVRIQTWLLLRLRDWERHGKASGSELRGVELEDAERWLERADARQGRNALPEQAHFILESRRGAVSRQRRFIAGVVAALLLTTTLALAALWQYYQSEQGRQVAQAQRLAAQSVQLRLQGQPHLGLLLAIEAIRTHQDRGESPLVASLDSLFAGNSSVGGRGLGAHPAAINSLARTPDGRLLVSGGDDGSILVWDIPERGTEGSHRPQRTLQTGTRPIRALAVSPSGRWLLSGSDGPAMMLWSLADPKADRPTAIWMNHKDRITQVGFLPGERGFFSGSWDGTVLLYSLEDGKPGLEPRIFRVQAGEIRDVSVSPDGRWLAAMNATGKVWIWDLAARDPSAQPRVLDHHTSAAHRVLFSPTGRWLVTAGLEHGCWLIETASLESPPLRRVHLKGHEAGIFALGFSPDDRWLATGSDDETARLWDLSAQPLGSGSTILVGHKGAVRQVAFSPTPPYRLVTVARDRTARLWDFDSPQDIKSWELRGHDDEIGAMVLSPDGQRLFTGGRDMTLREWELAERSLTSPTVPQVLRGHQDHVRELDVGEQGLMSADFSGQVCLWSPPPQAGLRHCFHPVQQGARATDVALRAKDHQVAVGTSRPQSLLCTVDPMARTERCTALSQHSGPVTRVQLSPGRRWLATGEEGGRVMLWDLTASEPTPQGHELLPRHKRSISALDFDPRERWLVTGSQEGAVRLWDLRAPLQGDAGVALPGHTDLIKAATFSADGRWLVTSGSDITPRLWDLTQASPANAAFVLEGHEQVPLPLGIQSVKIDPHARWLVTSGVDSTVRVWRLDREGASHPRVLRGHGQGIFGHGVKTVDFSPGGRWLSSGGEDGLVRLWNLDSSNPAIESVALRAHQGAVNVTRFSPDGDWLYSVGDDGTIRIWPMKAAALLEGACRAIGRNFSQAEWDRFFPGVTRRPTCPSLPLQ